MQIRARKRSAWLKRRFITKTALVMKLISILILGACLQVSAKGVSQTITFSGKDISLRAVFSVIKKQTGYAVMYNADQLGKTRPVNVNVTNLPLEDFLKQVLNGQPFEYSIENTTIFISAKPPVGESADQKLKIPEKINLSDTLFKLNGRIINQEGEPIEGASIAVKGTRKGTSAKAGGRFSINVKKGVELVVSFVGYNTQEIKVSQAILSQPGLQIMIVLSPAVSVLDEVAVVSTGYQTIAKERATGSFSQIQQADLERKITFSLADRMEGMASGLLITSNILDAAGRPTQKPLLSIRGRNTFNASQDPLIVVDGFPYEGDISLLNPEDIARITLLKDAAAASIWGVRAANGVIVIETKKGKQFRQQISFSANYTLSEEPDLGYRPVASSADYLDFEREAVDKGRIPDPAGPFMPAVSQGADLWYRYRKGQITTAQRDELISQLSSYDYKDQYSKYLLRNQQLQQYNLSASGGNEFVRYYLSGSYSKELPVARGNSNQRVTINSTNNFSLSKKLSVQLGFMAIMSTAVNNGLGLRPLAPGTSTILPYDRIVDDSGHPIQYARAYSGRALDSLTGKGYLPWKYDYISELDNADNTRRYNLYRFNASVKYNIWNGLSLDLSGLYEKSFDRGRNFYNTNTYTVRDIINTATSIQSGRLVYGLPMGGILNLDNIDMQHYNLRGKLDYNKQIKRDHRIDATGGAEMRQMWTTTASTRLYGYDDQTLASMPVNYDLYFMTAVSGFPNKPENPNSLGDIRDRFLSWFFNGNYTFKTKYVLSGSARLDDSNLFGASKSYRATPLWSIGGMWKLGEESFLQPLKLNRLNLRLTYGVNGNVDKTTSPFLIATVFPFPAYFNGQQFARIQNPANPLLRWEKTKTFNIGIDLSVFNGRMDVTADLYRKRSYDLLGPAVINPTYGFTRQTVNTARLDNHGLDLSIGAAIIRTTAFQWKTELNFAYNVNKVASSNLQRETVPYYIRSGTGGNPIKGNPIEGIYSYRSGMLDSIGRPTVIAADGRKLAQADISNDLSTLSYSGTTVPRYFGGFTNTFRYKQFELSTLITYKFGFVFRKPGVSYFSYYNYKTISNDVGKRWKQPGDEVFTKIPVLPGNNVNYNNDWYTLSDELIRNGAHVRLREVSLNYECPSSLLKKLHLQQLSLMIYARNLALWTANKDGIDPDYVPSPENTILPPARSFAIALRTSF